MKKVLCKLAKIRTIKRCCLICQQKKKKKNEKGFMKTCQKGNNQKVLSNLPKKYEKGVTQTAKVGTIERYCLIFQKENMRKVLGITQNRNN